MIKPRLYLYDSTKSDYKGTDYSANVLAAFNITDDLTEVLDVAELTLAGLPFSQEFDPTTKFILELYDTTAEQVVEYYHLAVAEDVVKQPVMSDNNYFNHTITFNEASVIAQGRIVDNCSETFKLKDVNINNESIYNPNKKASGINNPSSASAETTYYSQSDNLLRSKEDVCYKRKFNWVFTESYLPASDPNYGEASAWNKVKLYEPVSGIEHVKLPIPLLATYFGAKDSTGYETNMNLCSVTVEVYSSDDGVTWTKDTNLSRDVNPALSNATENNWKCDWRFLERYGGENRGYGMTKTQALRGQMQEYYKKFADYDNTMSNRFVDIPLVANKQYCVIVKPKIFATSLRELGTNKDISLHHHYNRFYGDSENMLYTYSKSYLLSIFSLTLGIDYTISNGSTKIILPTTENYNGAPMMQIKFSTYVAGSNMSVFLKSAPALSAYDLFVDAQLKTQQTTKEIGKYIKEKPLAYYLDKNDIDTLQSTEIIESSFNQKNFWEVLLEVGKYIHAIPYIEFGEDDRFVVRWRYLGQTEKALDVATKMSIFNSKSIENYVGALSSYVTNMIQRGAQIVEYVAPKSESEDLLVYNDVAVIKTSKPIIEIIGLSFRCINTQSPYYVSSNQEYDITDNIFEHNIYELLDIVASTKPNKGLAIYYNLGENVIRGLNYQLPSVNTGDGETEYAIKRIIGSVLLADHPDRWLNIRVNDFAFKVTYRTKESVRSEQSRPDLRKYLINSKYETIPHHKQFNNQQDISVDSVKFGNQTYGKLIKTGNTDLKTTEWNDNISNLKKAGQLVDIRGNIYYVAKATHTYFQDHILSEITYSKDYNQLSEIIGIPSEPRFFEISEQSMVDRQVVIGENLLLTTDTNRASSHTYTNTRLLRRLLFGSYEYPKYAITQFKNDADNPDPTQGLAQFSKDFIHPISAYSIRNTLSFKWAMVDNFSAGDSVDAPASFPNPQPSTDQNYATLIHEQYTDVYGRADLIDFAIIQDLYDADFTKAKIRAFPKSPYRLQLSNIGRSYNSDYGNGSALSNLSYYANPNDAHTPITDDIVSFTIPYGPNVLGAWGNIVDSNDVSILPNMYLTDGDYFIINFSGTYSIFAVSTDDEVYWTFTKVYTCNDLSAIQDILSAANFKDLGQQIMATSENDLDDIEFGTNEHGIALIKDNRERISFNFNIQMLTDSDRFILSGYLWQQNKGNVRLALLDQEVNKIINNTIPTDSIKATFNIANSANTMLPTVDIDYMLRNEADLSWVKAIALIDDVDLAVGAGVEKYFLIARNVSDLTDAEKRKNWDFYGVQQSDFKQQ